MLARRWKVAYPGIRVENNFIAIPRELAENALLLFGYITSPQNVQCCIRMTSKNDMVVNDTIPKLGGQ